MFIAVAAASGFPLLAETCGIWGMIDEMRDGGQETGACGMTTRDEGGVLDAHFRNETLWCQGNSEQVGKRTGENMWFTRIHRR